MTAVDERAIGRASQHDRRGRRQAVRDGGRRLRSDAVGHASAIDHADTHALAPDGRPVAILARVKRKGVRAIENRNGFHGKPLADPAAAITELGGRRALVVAPHRPIAADQATPSQLLKQETRALARVPKALCRTRTDDPFLTMEVLYRLS